MKGRQRRHHVPWAAGTRLDWGIGQRGWQVLRHAQVHVQVAQAAEASRGHKRGGTAVRGGQLSADSRTDDDGGPEDHEEPLKGHPPLPPAARRGVDDAAALDGVVARQRAAEDVHEAEDRQRGRGGQRDALQAAHRAAHRQGPAAPDPVRPRRQRGRGGQLHQAAQRREAAEPDDDLGQPHLPLGRHVLEAQAQRRRAGHDPRDGVEEHGQVQGPQRRRPGLGGPGDRGLRQQRPVEAPAVLRCLDHRAGRGRGRRARQLCTLVGSAWRAISAQGRLATCFLQPLGTGGPPRARCLPRPGRSPIMA
mmetsp:Transcript_78062/g.221341  ORF Transcript_78062/g.221341 Transcript_78062/m.221341 type:complete len:306 (-) Transcript_78062:3-920(-)